MVVKRRAPSPHKNAINPGKNALFNLMSPFGWYLYGGGGTDSFVSIDNIREDVCRRINEKFAGYGYSDTIPLYVDWSLGNIGTPMIICTDIGTAQNYRVLTFILAR